jgi:lysyl-tRNA synthetase, class II
MASEETLIQVRLEKHQKLNGGTYPLASHSLFDVEYVLARGFTDPKTSLNPNELGIPVTLHGRISAFRKSGGISFIKLTDQSGSLQLIAAKNVLSDYENLSLLDFGDIIEVVGPTCLSKTGEKSLLITSWKVLTKAHRPPPEKFAGLSDPELIHRKRYLDLMSSEESRARFMVRSAILRNIRKYMESEEFMEVETSTLSSVASGANAKPFVTHHNALDIDLRLRVAPELNLKRLLVGGFSRVYEIGRAYRNEGIDTRHNPEFTIMESYEAYSNFERLIDFTRDLLQNVDVVTEHTLHNEGARNFYQQWKERRTFTLSEFRVVPMAQAVQSVLDKLQMRAYLDEPVYGEWYQFTPPEYCSDAVMQRQAKIDFMGLLTGLNKSNSRGERLALFFEYLVEPFLTEDYRTADGKYSVPVFITEYPQEVCPLARPNDLNPEVCDRFELFVEGRELANAFQELNDPTEQAVRFQQQLAHNHKDPMDYDADYVEALEHGMPPAIGFGMGIDRLVMLLTNTTSIKDVILFPTLKPVKPEHVRDSTSQTQAT